MAKVRNLISGLTHCIAAGLSLIGLVILIIYAAINGNAFDIVSFTIFGIGLLLFYLFSTLYHWLNIGEKNLKLFKKFTHIMTYVFISSSYIPICFGPLLGPWGWSMFGVILGFASLGITFSAIWIKLPRAIAIILPIIFSTITLITSVPLIKIYEQANLLYSLWWLVISGIFYILGKTMCLLKWPKTKFYQFD